LQESLPCTSVHALSRQHKARPAGARADLIGACVRFAGRCSRRGRAAGYDRQADPGWSTGCRWAV